MSNPNEGTDWAAQAGPGEAKLDLKDPIAEHDPNVGTRWADPVDESKPRPRVPREIDKFLDQPTWTCLDCGFSTLTENGKAAHLREGRDGMTPCQREKLNFKPVKNCAKCGGTGRGAGQCPSCSGSGEGSASAKCRGCSGKGVPREGAEESCSVCGGSGTRTYCAECAGSGEIAHCGECGGTGKVQMAESGGANATPAPAAPALDQDALANKIAAPIIESMNQGFAMLAQALAGRAPKPEKKTKKKGKAKGTHASPSSVPGSPEAGGSEPVPGVE